MKTLLTRRNWELYTDLLKNNTFLFLITPVLYWSYKYNSEACELTLQIALFVVSIIEEILPCISPTACDRGHQHHKVLLTMNKPEIQVIWHSGGKTSLFCRHYCLSLSQRTRMWGHHLYNRPWPCNICWPTDCCFWLLDLIMGVVIV